jgi:hypothetical protein
MNTQEVLTLLQFLDDLFQLGGRLITTAMEKAPLLKTDPLPLLDEMDAARMAALERIKNNHE